MESMIQVPSPPLRQPQAKRSRLLLLTPKLDAVITTAPTVGAVSAFSNQTSNAAGTVGDLAGTIDSSHTIGLTAGGAGTTATGQFVTELTIK